MAERKRGLLKRNKQSAEDKAFTPEKVQQRIKEYEEVKNRTKQPEPQQKEETKKPSTDTDKYDENEGVSFNKAFGKAKKAGAGLFKWKGKMYNSSSK